MMKKTKNLLAGLSVVLLVTLACRRTSAVPPSVASSLPLGESTHTLNHDGLERSYVVYIPGSIDRSKPVPLVFVLHGGTGNAESAIRMSGFNQVADQNGFGVVYPNGTGRLSDNLLLTWNSGNCCGYAETQNVDDVGLMRAIVTDLKTQLPIDPKRIYATGMSNGGMLAQRLGCQAADLFAAIAPVAGTLNFSACNPSEPISVIEFHGTADQHILYNGGYGPKAVVQVDFASVQDSVGFWVTFDKCNSQPQTNTTADIRHETWAGCTGSSSVELYTVIGGGHAWPGSVGGPAEADQPTMTIPASQLIWQFFAAHPKP
jgi:polyhydroxybutyrate depolymerase